MAARKTGFIVGAKARENFSLVAGKIGELGSHLWEVPGDLRAIRHTSTMKVLTGLACDTDPLTPVVAGYALRGKNDAFRFRPPEGEVRQDFEDAGGQTIDLIRLGMRVFLLTLSRF